MTDKEQKAAAKKFAEFWKDKGYEKGNDREQLRCRADENVSEHCE